MPKQPFNLATVKVEKNIPYVKRLPQGVGKWDELFDKVLAAPGDSIAFPVEYHGGIGAAALKRSKSGLPGVFKLSKISKTESRVWRIA